MPNIKNLSSVRNHIFILYYSFILYNNIKQKKKMNNRNQSQSSASKTTEIQLMKKINKEFEEKCIKLKNRIQRLKTEEEDYKKK